MTMLDRPTADKFDSREINRKAVASWSTVYHMLVDLRGFPNGDIRRLNPADAPLDPNKGRQQDGPRLLTLSGPSPYGIDGGPGAWVCRGNGASGPDVISMIEYLSGGADRRICADYLKSLTDRLVELPV
jgi:hypothetical protein